MQCARGWWNEHLSRAADRDGRPTDRADRTRSLVGRAGVARQTPWRHPDRTRIDADLYPSVIDAGRFPRAEPADVPREPVPVSVGLSRQLRPRRPMTSYYSRMANPTSRRSTPPVVVHREPREIQRLKALTRLLDTAFHIPGTRFRFGIDALIGLVPGIGDAVGAIFSCFIVFQAARLGASKATLARMMGNVALDTIVGEIPLLGDMFDAG